VRAVHNGAGKLVVGLIGHFERLQLPLRPYRERGATATHPLLEKNPSGLLRGSEFWDHDGVKRVEGTVRFPRIPFSDPISGTWSATRTYAGRPFPPAATLCYADDTLVLAAGDD